MPVKSAIARLYILDMPSRAEKAYDYIIPEDLRDDVRAGVFAEVPLGRGKREALVIGIIEKSDVAPEKLREIIRVLPVSPLSEEEMQICLFMTDRTFCTVKQAMSAIRPGGIYPENTEKFICASGEKTGEEISALLSSPEMKRKKKQTELINLVIESEDGIAKLDLKDKFGPAVIKSALSTGLLTEEERSSGVFLPPLPDIEKTGKEPVLNKEQSEAAEVITKITASGEPGAALLYGITGSGKTTVIKKVADNVIKNGGRVIMLIPEIALSPQTVSFFRAYYGNRVCVWHSALTLNKRREETERIKRGDYDIVIGTRSAVFVPMPDLKLIVIDEEQEHTYKSEMSPRYKAHDIASLRCGIHKATLVLSSATPSVESMFKAKSGKYTLVSLSGRYGSAKLPSAVTADLRADFKRGITGHIGSVLREKLTKCIEDGNQAILFLNRRGYNSFVSCPKCGYVITCPHCSVSLTRHGSSRYKGLRCHYCGFAAPVPAKCPVCGSEHLLGKGFGTQMVEEELKSLFGEKCVIRMDADTTGTKDAYEEILGRFRAGEAPILLGTQMVTKGHDFPNVTLSGVIFADNSLYIEDYRANEETFSVITQILGRSGRSDKEGEAVIQTNNPDHPVLEMAKEQDYGRFYENEIALRRSLIFPPYCDILTATFTSKSAKDASDAADYFAALTAERNESAKEKLDIQMFGPFESPIYKLSETYNMRIVIKFRQSKKSRAFFAGISNQTSDKFGRKINISLDINPSGL